jgi:hypothetical protein
MLKGTLPVFSEMQHNMTVKGGGGNNDVSRGGRCRWRYGTPNCGFE